MAIRDASVENSRQLAIEWLRARVNYERSLVAPYNERQLDLARMRMLLARLGQPDAKLKIVHVAGTKGKGSTSAMIAGMLTAAGHCTGVFSSPHLERIEERFAVDGAPCTAAELAALVDQLRPVAAVMDADALAAGDPYGGPTYFEATTAIALLHFVARKCDAAVLEVGLGGRLDSTNVCRPVVSVITSISFDHMQQLGNTLAAIAGEKAGIIKPGVPVVTGVTEAEPLAVIARIADKRGSRLIRAGRDFHFRYVAGKLDFESKLAGREFDLHAVPLAMRGAHQAANAAVALATIAELRQQGWNISTDAMQRGLAETSLPGRVEFLAGRPDVVLDTAHNPASANALAEALSEIPRRGRRTLILAVSQDKDVAGIVRELVPHFDRVIATRYQENPRAVPAGDLYDLIQGELVRAAGGGKLAGRVEICATPREAWETVCRTAEPDELVCIAGSFYLAAELRPLVVSKARQDAGTITR
jgi:dihydrofolate synthase/folylpolyglutamate synthase